MTFNNVNFMVWLLLIAVTVLLSLLLRLRKTLRTEQDANASLRGENQNLTQSRDKERAANATLRAEIAALAPVRDVHDAKTEDDRILPERLQSGEIMDAAAADLAEAQELNTSLVAAGYRSAATLAAKHRPLKVLASNKL